MTSLDRARAYVDGALSAADRVSFEAELSSSKELAQTVEAYRLLVRATSEAAPVRTTTFEELPLGRPRAVRWAIAATILLAIGLAASVWQRNGQKVPVRVPDLHLAAIPLRPVDAPEIPEWPRTLIDYRTSDSNGLRWLTDVDDAEEVAVASGRPLLVFVHHPQCPICIGYANGPFRDPKVTGVATDFVLLKLEVEHLPVWVSRSLPRGWPVLAVFNLNGKRLSVLTGAQPSDALARWLRGSGADLRESEEFDFPKWDDVRQDARTLDAAENSDDPAFRLWSWREVEARANSATLLEFAHASRLQMEATAQRAIELAQVASSDRADPLLADAEEELRGTMYAQDLANVRKHLRRYGSFPVLR